MFSVLWLCCPVDDYSIGKDETLIDIRHQGFQCILNKLGAASRRQQRFKHIRYFLMLTVFLVGFLAFELEFLHDRQVARREE